MEPETFKVGDKTYEIPPDMVKAFLQDFPNAIPVQTFKSGDKTYEIPIDLVDQFKKDNPDFTPLKKTEDGKEKSGYSNTSLFMQRAGASLGAMFAGTPEFLFDLSKTITDPLNKWVFGREARTFDETFGEDNVLNRVADYYKEQQDVLSGEIAKTYDKTITNHIKSGEYKKASQLAMLSLAESVPIMVGIAMTRNAGATAGQTTAIGGLVFGAGEYQEVEDNEEMTDTAKTLGSLGKGLAEGFFEQWGVTKAFGALSKTAVEDLGKTASKEVIESAFKNSYRPVLRKYGIITTEESLGEAATQFSQNAITKFSGEDPDIDLMEGVTSAAIVGLLGGGLFSTPSFIVDRNKIKNIRKNNYEGLSDEDLEGVNVTPEQLEDIRQKSGIRSYMLDDKYITREEAESIINNNPEELAKGDIDLRIRGDEDLIKQYNEALKTHRKRSPKETETEESDIQGDQDIDVEADQDVSPEDVEGPVREPADQDIDVPTEGDQPVAPATRLDFIEQNLLNDEDLPDTQISLQFTDPSGKPRSLKMTPQKAQNLIKEETTRLQNLRSCIGI